MSNIESARSESVMSSQPYHYYNEPSIANHGQNREKYYNLESVSRPQNFSCEVCNRSFYTQGQLARHIDQHVSCPFPECKFTANEKMIDQHINHQHMLINFEALQIDDEAWISERKKRFPTAQRADLRRAEQIERIKRGERIGKGNNKFSKAKKLNTEKPGQPFKSKDLNSDKYEISENVKHKLPLRKRTNPPRKRRVVKDLFLPLTVDPYDSDPESKWGVPAFKGTKTFYENTGEMAVLGMSINDNFSEKLADIYISDEEDWSNTVVDNKKTTLHNALGSLIGAYESNSESETEIVTVNAKDKLNTYQEVKSEVKVSELSKAEYVPKRKRRHNNLSDKFPSNKKIKGPIVHKPIRRRPTLLQKLLEPNIIHERNLILQCIRYVANNSFFQSNDES